MLTASHDGSANVWDTRTGALRVTVEGHMDVLSIADFSPDGRSILTGSPDGSAKVWDASTGRVRTSLLGSTATPLVRASFSPFGAVGHDRERRRHRARLGTSTAASSG
ncbi:MAG: hypothetical protein IPH72_32800 [Sandaracinaceae bacterium]|nr:hypothetical protein [Sandaracinaceae bacterium]